MSAGKKPLRVAAYCRVSTDGDDQVNSFESQQRYFRAYIAQQPHWELAGIFADEGLSGTSTKKRLAFQRMIACARAGTLDLIVTKEISRFARNTLDSIYYTRELKRLGVGVLFLSDNLCTLDGDAELRLAILSSIAQEESAAPPSASNGGKNGVWSKALYSGATCSATMCAAACCM